MYKNIIRITLAITFFSFFHTSAVANDIDTCLKLGLDIEQMTFYNKVQKHRSILEELSTQTYFLYRNLEWHREAIGTELFEIDKKEKTFSEELTVAKKFFESEECEQFYANFSSQIKKSIELAKENGIRFNPILNINGDYCYYISSKIQMGKMYISRDLHPYIDVSTFIEDTEKALERINKMPITNQRIIDSVKKVTLTAQHRKDAYENAYTQEGQTWQNDLSFFSNLYITQCLPPLKLWETEYMQSLH